MTARLSTFLALFNVFSYDAGIVALSVWPAWLVVVALTLAPWIFNPGALTLNSVLSCGTLGTRLEYTAAGGA